MATFDDAIGFNVEGSLNKWMAAKLATYTLPSWLNSLPAIVYTFPIDTASMPCFSFWHIPVADDDIYLGRQIDGAVRGKRARAMLEVSCWALQTNPKYLAQLRTMGDLVRSVATTDDSVAITDYATDPANPTATSYRVAILGVTDNAPQQDVDTNAQQVGNLSVWRRRLLIDYTYTFRSSV